MSEQTHVTREQIAELGVNRQQHPATSPLVDAEARIRVLAQAYSWLRERAVEGDAGGEVPDAPRPV